MRHSVATVLACAGLLIGAARADQLTMKNGDRITGTIIKQDGKTITVKTDLFGVVTAPWDQVASVQTSQPVTVVLENGETVAGTLSTSEGQVAVTGQQPTVTAPPAQVTAIRNADEQKAYERLLHPSLFQLWSGVGTLGWAGTNGNAKTLTFTTTVDAIRQTRTDKLSLYFKAIKASGLVNNVSATTAQAVRGGIGYDRNISPRLFVNVFNNYDYDRFQSLDLRFVIGGGFGFHAIKSDRSQLDVLGGADYNHSSFSTPLTRNTAEAFWGDDYGYKLSGTSTLTQSFRMYDDLSELGEYRLSFDLALVTKIRRWLSWNVTLSDRYLSNPVPGRKTNDWLYSTGLGVTFGNK